MEQVYFASCAGRIKIGRSAKPEDRLREISAHLFDDLVLIAKVRGNASLERAIHKSLAQYRVRNEWFRDCPEVRALMADVLDRGAEAVSQFYRPMNQARGVANRIASGNEKTFMMMTANPWIGLFARLDDLLADAGGDARAWDAEPAAAKILKRARRSILRIMMTATSLADDSDALDRATGIVVKAVDDAQAAASRPLRVVFTINRRIAGVSKPPPTRLVPISRTFEGGLSAGLVM